MSLGSEGACALDAAGAVWCWGDSALLFPGELSTAGSENTCVAPFVSAGVPSVFGHCISPSPLKPKLVNEALAGSAAKGLSVAAGFGLCVLSEDGKVRCAPSFEVSSGDLVIEQFDTNSLGWCGVTTAGAAWCFVARNPGVKLAPVPGGQAFVQVSTGALSILALDADGGVWAGELTPGASRQDLVPASLFELSVGGQAMRDAQVSAQYWVTAQAFEANRCLLETGGTVTCQGWNTYGQLGNGQYRAMGGGSARVAGVNATALAVGSTHVCALDSAGAVSCWGSSFAGELGGSTGSTLCDLGGNQSTPCSAQPVRVGSLEPATRVWAGINFSCAETKAGALRCWGSNDTGQLGDASGAKAITTTIGP